MSTSNQKVEFAELAQWLERGLSMPTVEEVPNFPCVAEVVADNPQFTANVLGLIHIGKVEDPKRACLEYSNNKLRFHKGPMPAVAACIGISVELAEQLYRLEEQGFSARDILPMLQKANLAKPEVDDKQLAGWIELGLKAGLQLDPHQCVALARKGFELQIHANLFGLALVGRTIARGGTVQEAYLNYAMSLTDELGKVDDELRCPELVASMLGIFKAKIETIESQYFKLSGEATSPLEIARMLRAGELDW